MCRVLQIAPSTWHEHVRRRANPDLHSKRAKEDERLSKEIIRVHKKNFGVYCAKKVWLQLNREGFKVGRDRVARLMARLGLEGMVRGKVVRTTRPDKAAACPFDLVNRQFHAPAPNMLWVSDFTYVSTWAGMVYVALVIDVFARRIVGWRVSRTQTASFVLDALEQALHARRQPRASSIIATADRNLHSSGRRNTLTLEVAMTFRKRRSHQSGRTPLPSPGRPPEAGRSELERFWLGIALGMPSENAALEAGISQPVGARLFRKAGGMPPSMFRSSAKPPCGRYLSFAEREEIALLRVQGLSMRNIGRRLDRSASTISRELRRNAATRSGGLDYRASTAQWHAERSGRRPKIAKLALNQALRLYVEERLAGTVAAPDGIVAPVPTVPWIGHRHGQRKDRRWGKAWSPEQIAQRLAIDFPDDETMRIGHEAIYQALFIQGRGALRRELTACLRTGRALRTPRARVGLRGKGFVSSEIMMPAPG
jgi:hypothetical protein